MDKKKGCELNPAILLEIYPAILSDRKKTKEDWLVENVAIRIKKIVARKPRKVASNQAVLRTFSR